MKGLLLLLLMTGALGQAQSQFVHKIKADSVLITNDSCSAELNLENSTKNIKGFLYNKGNGRTEFRKLIKLNDSTIIIGEDTLGVIGNFTNGLTRTGNTIKLGGALSETTNWTGTNNTHTFTFTNNNLAGFTPGFNMTFGSSISNSWGLQVTNSGSNSYAIRGMNTNTSSSFNVGVLGSASNGIGVRGNTNSISGGAGVEGLSLKIGSVALRAQSAPNDVGSGTMTARLFDIYRTSAVNVGNGIGALVTFSFPSYDDGGVPNLSPDQPVQMEAKMLNLFGDNRTAEFNFKIMGDSVVRNVLKLHGDGNIMLPAYTGSNWQVNDTTTYKPVVMDANGNIRKLDSWAVSGSGSNAPGVSSIASSSTITPNALTDDVYAVTALAENTTIAAPSGTFHDGQIIVLRLKDNGTSRTISWNSTYRGGTDFSLPTLTGAGKTMYITFIWNSPDSKLDGVGLSKGY
jgi:hypothetical protein